MADANRNAVINSLKKKYGDHVILSGVETVLYREVVPTGSIDLDMATGVGGIPMGRMSLLLGNEQTGKTTLSLCVLGNAQILYPERYVLYVDLEHKLETSWAQVCGVKLDRMDIIQPMNATEGFEAARDLILTGEYSMAVVDSIAAVFTEAELKKGLGTKESVGERALLMNKALRVLTPIISRKNTGVILVNQFRENIGIAFGNPLVTPGGRAAQYHVVLRMQLLAGHKAKITKNQVGHMTPFGTVGQFPIPKTQLMGIDRVSSLVIAAERLGLIEKSGKWFGFGGKNYDGKGGLIQALRGDLQTCNELYDQIIEQFDWPAYRDNDLLSNFYHLAGAGVIGEELPEDLGSDQLYDSREVKSMLDALQETEHVKQSGKWVHVFGQAYEGFNAFYEVYREDEELRSLFNEAHEEYIHALNIVDEEID